MLPPGHIAAGFLVTEAFLKIVKPDLLPEQITHLLWWGIFFSFAPDLDNFVAFAKVKAWWYKQGVDSSIHRKFYSHVPLLWLVAGSLIYFVAPSEQIKMIGLLLWIGSWTHFILDSIDYGVMWLWPFNTEVWALRNRGIKREITGRSFFEYWLNMLKAYTVRATFYVEVVILLITIYFYFKF